MGIDMTALLVHSDAVPPEARDAMRAALTAPAETRERARKLAASALYRSTDLDCAEARDLVGLPPGLCG